MSDTGNLHVVFGTGPVGLAVMDELVAQGKSVRMINRSGRVDLPEGVELVTGDASDPAFTKEASAGAEVVYQCLNPPYTLWPELFPPLQAAVLEGAIASGAKLVSMENVYMYGSTGGQPMREEMPYAADTRKGRVRAEMARALLDAHDQGKVRVAIGRASDFYGPRVLSSAMGDRVFPAALNGKKAQVLGNVDLPHTYTYIHDIGKGLAILGEREEALGQVWHLPSAETVSTRRFLEMVYAEAGHPLAIQQAPKLLLRLIGLFNGNMREILEMIYQFEEPFILDDSKFTQQFGNHATPLREAIRTTLAWYRVQYHTNR